MFKGVLGSLFTFGGNGTLDGFEAEMECVFIDEELMGGEIDDDGHEDDI